jgi:hypothetical protein
MTITIGGPCGTRSRSYAEALVKEAFHFSAGLRVVGPGVDVGDAEFAQQGFVTVRGVLPRACGGRRFTSRWCGPMWSATWSHGNRSWIAASCSASGHAPWSKTGSPPTSWSAGRKAARRYADRLPDDSVRPRHRWLVSHKGYALLRRHVQIATMNRSDSTTLPSGISMRTGPCTSTGPEGTTRTMRGSGVSVMVCPP